MSRKLSSRIRKFLLAEKKRNASLSCRKACNMVERRFLVKISKSRVNLLWKERGLSQAVGRAPSKKFVLKTQFKNAGFCFLLAADSQLGASRLFAENIKSLFPHLSLANLQKISQALLYQTLFKDEALWTIKNYNTKKFNILNIYNTIMDCHEEFLRFLSEFNLAQNEAQSIELILKDKTKLTLDSQFRSIWLASAPEAFASPINLVKKDIEPVFFQDKPLILFTIPGFSLYSQEISQLLCCLEGNIPEKHVSQINLIDKQTKKATVLLDIPPKKHYIIFGLWPWQYQTPLRTKPKGGYRRFWFSPLTKEFYIGESEMSITQPTINQLITIRLIHIKSQKIGFPILTLGTNLPKDKVKTKQILSFYLNKWPDIEQGYQEYLQLQKQEAESFRLSTPEFHRPNLDVVLNYLLSTLNTYSQRHFFPAQFSRNDLISLKQQFYSLPGSITYRKKALFCQFQPPEGFEYKQELALACRRVNEAGCELSGGVRLWLATTEARK